VYFQPPIQAAGRLRHLEVKWRSGAGLQSADTAPDVHGGEAVLPVALLLRMRISHKKQQAGSDCDDGDDGRCGWHFGDLLVG